MRKSAMEAIKYIFKNNALYKVYLLILLANSLFLKLEKKLEKYNFWKVFLIFVLYYKRFQKPLKEN